MEDVTSFQLFICTATYFFHHFHLLSSLILSHCPIHVGPRSAFDIEAR